MKLSTLIGICSLLGVAGAQAAGIYVGDVATDGLAVPAGSIGPDGANGGALTYAFFSPSDTYTNTSGFSQQLIVTEVNFFSLNAGTLTPFVGKLIGGGAAGADYDVLAVGEGIAGSANLNNAAFTVAGTNPTITLGAGETLVAGFHQTGNPGMVPWEEPGGADGDYLFPGDSIPAGGTGPLGGDANWSNLGREYRFNVGLNIVPEPSSAALLIPGVAGLLLLMRRRRSH